MNCLVQIDWLIFISYLNYCELKIVSSNKWWYFADFEFIWSNLMIISHYKYYILNSLAMLQALRYAKIQMAQFNALIIPYLWFLLIFFLISARSIASNFLFRFANQLSENFPFKIGFEGCSGYGMEGNLINSFGYHQYFRWFIRFRFILFGYCLFH